AQLVGGVTDHRPVHVARLDAPTRGGILDGDDDDVAHAGKAALRSAEHLDALDALGAAVVSDIKIGLHLDHRSGSFSNGLPGEPGGSVQLLVRSAAQAVASGALRVSTRSITFQVLSLEIGAVSSMRTVSPS